MNKNVFLGLDKSGKYCCLLKTLASMEMIKNNLAELDESDFVHDSTNWNGCDETERTLEIKNLEIVGKPLFLPHALIFSGYDYDHGHEYQWEFAVTKICATNRKGLSSVMPFIKGGTRDY